MKHMIPLLATSLLLLAGCGRVYQVTSFSYVGDHPGEFPNESLYEEVSITYDFWAENGTIAFTVRNHLNESVTLDVTRSSFDCQGRSLPYSLTGNQLSTVILAPQSSYQFKEGVLGIPESTTQQVGLGEVIPIDESSLPYGVLFRNYLCYYREGNAQFPSYTEDGFMVSESVLAGESAFPSYSATLRQHQIPAAYRVGSINTAERVTGYTTLLSSLFCIIIISTDQD